MPSQNSLIIIKRRKGEAGLVRNNKTTDAILLGGLVGKTKEKSFLKG
jgi:hypothetical protein